MMLWNKRRFAWVLLLVLVWAGCAAAATEGDKKQGQGKVLAVVYTQPNYQGIAWKITEVGNYDLHWLIRERGDEESLPFDLPSDSIMSIRARPGYSVTLYEHGDFGGKSVMWDGNAPDLGEWARQASSLQVKTGGEADEGEIDQWLQEIEHDGQHFTEPMGEELSDEDIAEVLAEYKYEFSVLKGMGEEGWYDITDENLKWVGKLVLSLFEQLGYNVEGWTPDSFTQQVNNFYDWRKDLSTWRVMCLVFNVDAEKYEKVFDAMK